MSCLDVALADAEMGLYVFPCKPYDDAVPKAPYTEHGLNDASNDPEQIRVWWKRWPHALIGVNCGKSGLVVVDLDMKDGKDGLADWARHLDGREIPRTFNVRTPSGGWHGWYRDGGVKYKSNAGKLGCADPSVPSGVDVRAQGGYVIAPGPYGYDWHGEMPLALDDIPVMPKGVLVEGTGSGSAGHWSKLDRDSLDPRDLAALEALEALGGHGAYLSGEYVAVTRPGKMAGASASIGYLGPGMVNLFTPNWPKLEERLYDVDELRKLVNGTRPPTDAGVDIMSLEECHAVFRRWLGAEYDLDALDGVLATAAAERLGGDPLWLLLISGSGNAKTETVQALSGAGAHVTSTIASEGALLSATAKKERSKEATGGLLRQIGDSGILVVKDMTSILSMSRETRNLVLAAVREVHDGRWVRQVGVDGGRKLEWEGHVVIVGAVTTAWDRAHDVIASMGDRFLLLRMDSTEGRLAAGRQSRRNVAHEEEMRAELAAAVAGVLAGADVGGVEITDAEAEGLLAAANLVTLARTGVDYDYRGDVIDAHAPEMPTRFMKQLVQVVRGGVAIGMERIDALELALRCARDSMPPLRLAILDDLDANPDSTPTEVRRRLDKPRATVDRQLQALHILGVAALDELEQDGKTSWHYSLAEGIDPSNLKTFPDLSVPTPRPQRKEASEDESPHTPSDISGNAQTAFCASCGKTMWLIEPGQTVHPACPERNAS